jgi:tetratricopeptide (TPR) repeat protein
MKTGTTKTTTKTMGKMKHAAWITVSLGFLILSGCATATFTVTSEPQQADVYYVSPVNGEKKVVGKTPLNLPMSEFKSIIGNDVSSGQYFPLMVEKNGFLSQTYQLPASRYGTLVTSLNVKLKQGDDANEEKTARKIIDHLFLAQKYALTQQFERAQIELDKVLTNFPTFPRALSMRASIYYAQKNWPESLKWYEEALKSDPQMDDAVKMTAKIRAIQSGKAQPDADAGKGDGKKTSEK